ncbi:MAG: TRAP transporter large permease [Clostridiales Family XIII bacterium]|jgi:tripartite ATP-independent transporter DctM subunit|nr:TRAP transporter large permease [Clostridiales Family XIII bacterium]
MLSLPTIGIIGIIVFLVLIFAGMNIGLSLLLTGCVGFYIINPNLAAATSMVQMTVTSQVTTYSLIVIPLFIMMGNFAYQAGLSSALFDAANKWLSRLPGNLACAAVAASAGFGAICGSCAATCATMGAISLPEMRKHGYADRLSTGSIAMGGTLGILIPPSTPMIIYCIMANNVSIGKMFAAGVLPGIMLAILCIITIVVLVKIHPNIAPPPQKCGWKARFKSLTGLIGVVVLFGVVLGGLFSGFFPATQSAAVGAFLAILLTAVNRKLSWANFVSAIRDTITTFAMTFLILIGATVFSKFLVLTTIPSLIGTTIKEADMPFWAVLILMTVVYIILGMIMDELPMILLTVPIFLPIVLDYGIDPIWFGIYIILVMELGAIAPPVGMNCFIIQGVSKDIPLSTIYKGALPFVITILVAVVIIYFFPQIVMVIPNSMG